MDTVQPRRLIAVVGPADADAYLYATAREVGRRLAAAGAVVVNGGLGGVMEASARGAAEAGGLAIAMLPGEDAGDANRWSAFVLPTGLGELRNSLIARVCLAMVAVGGSWGTESEIALAVRLGKPVVAIGGWTRRAADGAAVPAVMEVADAEEAVARLRAVLLHG
jgi:uncharacterized protein (TIGR00725 family)